MSEYKPNNILVTGGAGFIGCNFVRYMLETDSEARIVNLDLLTYAGSLDNLKDLPDKVNGEAREGALGHKVNGDQVNCETREYPLGEARSGELRSKRVSPGGEGALGYESRHTFVQGDICDRELIDGLLREHEIDTIVHFAAESHVDNSISGPEIFVKTNVMGTFTLLEAARQYWQQEKNWSENECRFHHISTDEVYGTLDKTDPAFSETTPYAPNSPYSASKAGSDHLVRAYFHTYGLPVTTTNCSNNYGPYQHSEKLIPTIIRNCVNQTSIPVYGDGSNIRDWLYVEDHCSGIDAVVRKGKLGEVYNIGGCNEWANIDIVKCICGLLDEFNSQGTPHKVNGDQVNDAVREYPLGEARSGELRSKRVSPRGEGALGHESLVTFVTDRAGHDWRYAIDASKMADDLDWTPAETFETGIRKTVEWYLDN